MSRAVTKTLPQRWEQLCGKKRQHVTNSYEYARWTLPYMFPEQNSDSVELQLAKDSVGAQAVNHLSNKVVSVLFPPQRMFFRLSVTEEMRATVSQAMQANGMDVEQAKEAVAMALVKLEEQLLSEEKKVQELMDMVTYRPSAVNAAKLLIITGNALEYHPEGAPVMIYNLHNYCVQRDLSGQVVEIMTKECKAFETFSPAVQEQINAGKVRRRAEGMDDVNIYTRIVLKDDGKFHVSQSADTVELDTTGATYTRDSLPWIPLTWDLVNGEDYGRGLVGQYAGAFHAVNVLSGSLLNIAAIMGDIKFLVHPQSLIDVPALNAAEPGTYHPGKEGDVTAIQIDKQADAQFISQMIDRYERQISQAFLLNSQLTRQAERVTAEEIRMQANELETSNGGIYSRLAGTWQVQLANVLLKQTGFEGLDYGIVPRIITGMDSLSRQGELDNLQQLFAYLGLLKNVPEEVLAEMHLGRLTEMVSDNLQVEYKKFMKTTAEKQAEQQQVLAQQQQLEKMAANRESQVAASKEAVKE